MFWKDFKKIEKIRFLKFWFAQGPLGPWKRKSKEGTLWGVSIVRKASTKVFTLASNLFQKRNLHFFASGAIFVLSSKWWDFDCRRLPPAVILERVQSNNKIWFLEARSCIPISKLHKMLCITTVDIPSTKFCKNVARDFVEVHFSKICIFDCRRHSNRIIFKMWSLGLIFCLKFFWKVVLIKVR